MQQTSLKVNFKATATAFGIEHVWNKNDRPARIYEILTGIMKREVKSAEDVLEDEGTALRRMLLLVFMTELKFGVMMMRRQKFPEIRY